MHRQVRAFPFALILAMATALGALAARSAPPEKMTSMSPYAAWKSGPSSRPEYFPIAVWLQNPKMAPRYREAGINLYVGLWKGPTEEQLAGLKAAGMRVICDQNEVGLKHRDDPTIAGWMHGDEPDNAQALPDGKGWGGPIPPEKIIADYKKIKAADPTRPVLLNLGQGVANDEWVGRAAKYEEYPEYCKGADIVSYDVYPVVGIRKKDGENYLWYVAKGVDRLREWSGAEKPVWNCIECTRISEPDKKATPHQVKAEVWMSLIHGSRGIIYFVHQFKPNFIEHALLEDPPMLAAVTRINRQIRELAPVLNSPTVREAVQVQSSSAEVPIAAMVKRWGGTTYLFTVGMRNGPTTGTFTLRGLPASATATVRGENRRLPIRNGRFEDRFDPYDVHLYEIR
jgi:hypothetical protein